MYAYDIMADRGWSGWTVHDEGAMDRRLSDRGLEWLLSAAGVKATINCSGESGSIVAVCGDVRGRQNNGSKH